MTLPKVCLFDVDGTLTPPRQLITPEVSKALEQLQKKGILVALVGGSDLCKILEQMGGDSALGKFDYLFSENGLVAHKNGQLIFKGSIIQELGEEHLQEFINYTLHALSQITLPFKRGTFIEFRAGMLNVSPCGRNCSVEERNRFEAYDREHHVRATLIADLERRFAGFNLTFAIGGQISLDVYPNGWDKRYCMRFLEKDGFTGPAQVYFFGDKTAPGGNDHTLYLDPRVRGVSVRGPDHTAQLLREMFLENTGADQQC
jgi:phosphomannomutase